MPETHDNHARKNVKGSRLPEGIDNQLHLRGGERAAAGRVADGGQPVIEAGKEAYPVAQLAPCRVGRDGWAIGKGQLRAPVFSYLECLHGAKLLLFPDITLVSTAYNRPLPTISGSKAQQPLSWPAGAVTLRRQ